MGTHASSADDTCAAFGLVAASPSRPAAPGRPPQRVESVAFGKPQLLPITDGSVVTDVSSYIRLHVLGRGLAVRGVVARVVFVSGGVGPGAVVGARAQQRATFAVNHLCVCVCVH